MSLRRRNSSRLASLAIEPLEDRRMMTGEPWGAQAKLNGQDVAASSYGALTGAGTSIVIIDTGVDYNHPDLGGGFGPGHKVVAGYDFVDNDADPMDTDGHGTGVAGMAAGLPYVYNGAKYQGIAPGANIIALRIDPGNYGWAKEAVNANKALQWVQDSIAAGNPYNIVAINMSFGKGHDTIESAYNTDGTPRELTAQLAALAADGIFMTSSSGNDGLQNGVPGIEYPGSDPNVYSIGATFPDGSMWLPSSTEPHSTERGPNMDLLAPGGDITLPYYNAATGTAVHISGGYGTSFSAPQAAGMAAILRQLDPTMTPAQMMSVMRRAGTTLYDPTTNLTFPRLNVANAIALTYLERGDANVANNTTGAATTLSFGGGDTASASGMRLLQGDVDYLKFTLGVQSDVDYALSRAGGSGAPTVDLIDSAGTVLKRLSATDAIRLAAGTYYLRVNAPSATLAGTYGLAVTQTPDDGLDNQTPQTAAPIPMSNGQGSLANLALLGGVDDYYSFTIGSTQDVTAGFNYGGASAAPTVQFLDTNGNFVATIDGSLTRRLTAGRYLIKVSSPTTLDGTYGVSVSATAVVAVVPPGANGSTNGIAYDAAGTLHLAYYDEVTNNLKYATRSAAGVWSSAIVVDPGFVAGQYVSLTMDPVNHPGIAYYDANNADLKYAHFNGSSWDVMTVDATFTTGYYPSLRYDAAGRPVISYYAKTGGNLRFAQYASGKWNLSTIDSGGDVGRYSSLALDPATGRWAVAYEDDSTPAFKYAAQTKSGGWAIATVDATTRYAGGYISLAFNPRNNLPSFSYYDAYNANLKYALFNGVSWSSQTVASKGTVGLYSNVLIDAAGNTDILYYNRGTDGMSRASFGSGGWSLEQITSDGGRWISRATKAGGAGQTWAYAGATGIKFLDV